MTESRPAPRPSKRRATHAPSVRSGPPTPAEAAVWSAEELPFVRDIHAHPHDDDPRLVFADWLEEQGDPRAQLIRVQCQLARLRLRDPHYALLEARADRLLEQHAARWLAAYPETPGVNWGSSWGVEWKRPPGGPRLAAQYFRRGFVESITVRHLRTFAAHAPVLFDELGATELTVPLSTARDASALARVPQFRQLGALMVTEHGGGDYLAGWKQLPAVWRLDVGPLHQIVVGLKQYLNGPHAHRLQSLSVQTVERRKDLEGLLACSQLASLDSFAMISDPWGEAIETLAESTMRLSHLQISTPNLSPGEFVEKCNKLFRAPVLSEAVSLSLGLVPAGMATSFGKLALPPNVTTLRLWGALGDADIAGLARTEAFAQLRRLKLIGGFEHALRDPAAQALARATGLRGLESLDLSGSPISDAGAESLVRSQALAGLKHLNLERSTVSEAKKAELRQAFAGRLDV